MLPRAPRFKRPLLRCKACDSKCGSQWSCSTNCVRSSVRLPTGGGTVDGACPRRPAGCASRSLSRSAWLSALTSKLAASDGFAPSTSRVRAGRSRCLSYEAIRSANRSRTGLSPIPAACVASNALAEFKMVGHLGAAPSISPPRTARIAVFLVPGHVCVGEWWSHGESHPDLRDAVASSCCWTMAPKWKRGIVAPLSR